MRLLRPVVALGAALEVGAWLVATLLIPGSWRYDVSALYAVGSPRPAVVMAGEAVFRGLSGGAGARTHAAAASW